MQKLTTGAVLALAALAPGQEASVDALENLELGGAPRETKVLRERAAGLTRDEAAGLRRQLVANPRDLETRLVLVFYEEPELRRKRRERPDPVPHGRLVSSRVRPDRGRSAWRS